MKRIRSLSIEIEHRRFAISIIDGKQVGLPGGHLAQTPPEDPLKQDPEAKVSTSGPPICPACGSSWITDRGRDLLPPLADGASGIPAMLRALRLSCLYFRAIRISQLAIHRRFRQEAHMQEKKEKQ